LIHLQNVEVKNADREKVDGQNVERKNAEQDKTSNGEMPTGTKGRK
jgi:hypothetical protein